MGAFSKQKDKRIEVLKNKIYLNGGGKTTPGKILRFIDRNTPDSAVNEFIAGLKAMAGRPKKSYEFAQMRAAQLVAVEGQEKTTPHYTIEAEGNTLHSTSNIPRVLQVNQKSLTALPSAILPKATNPGTIFTKQIYDIR